MNSRRKTKEKRIVESRVQFLDFTGIDIVAEKFRCNVLVKSSWIEQGVIEKYDPDKHWNPRLYIENGLVGFGYAEDIRYTSEVFDDCTEITEHRDIWGNFWERMELHKFPFDTQELSISVCSKFGSDVQIVRDENKISTIHPRAFFTFTEQQKFILRNIVRIYDEPSYEMESDYKNLSKFEPGNCLSTSVVITRKSNFFVANNFSIVLVLNLLALAVFAIPVGEATTRFSPLFTLLLTAFAYKIVTSSQLPTISYLTILDQAMGLSIVYLFLLGIYSAIISLISDEELKKTIDLIVFIVFIFLLILCCIIVMFLIMKAIKEIKAIDEEEKEYSIMLKNITDYDFSKYDY